VLLAEPDSTSLDLRFRLFGTNVRVHPLFWVVSAILGWRYSNDTILPGNGLGAVALWVFCTFLSILLHEFGHVWMGRAFGADGHILLHSMGGLAVGSNAVPSHWQRILVSFAGPGIQLLLWAVLAGAVLLGYAPAPDTPAFLMLNMLLWINLFWPVFNLLPVWPLDGGMITREVCQIASRDNGLLTSLWISFVVSAALAVNALWPFARPFAHQTGNPWLVFFADFLPGGTLAAIFFALFAVTSFQLIQYENQRRRSPWEDQLPWER
jgi:Zn-dependent protease